VSFEGRKLAKYRMKDEGAYLDVVSKNLPVSLGSSLSESLSSLKKRERRREGQDEMRRSGSRRGGGSRDREGRPTFPRPDIVVV